MPDTIRVGSNRISNSSVTGNKIADNAVRGNNIVAGTITSNLIANGSITNAQLQEPNAFEDYFLLGLGS
jgi:cation transport ATPase